MPLNTGTYETEYKKMLGEDFSQSEEEENAVPDDEERQGQVSSLPTTS